MCRLSCSPAVLQHASARTPRYTRSNHSPARRRRWRPPAVVLRGKAARQLLFFLLCRCRDWPGLTVCDSGDDRTANHSVGGRCGRWRQWESSLGEEASKRRKRRSHRLAPLLLLAQSSSGAYAVLIKRSADYINRELASLESAIQLLPSTALGCLSAIAHLSKHIDHSPSFQQLESTLVLQWGAPSGIDLATLGVGKEGVEVVLKYCRKIGALRLAEAAEAAGEGGERS